MKTWNYIAIFLEQESKATINRLYNKVPEGWTRYGDHVTLAFNDGVDQDTKVDDICHRMYFGVPYRVRVLAIARTDRVYALKVEVKGDIRHITLATAPDVAPVESNNIPEDAWVEETAFVSLLGGLGFSLNGKISYKRPRTGRSARIWSALQGFDFPKGELMLACMDAGAPITEEQYYKAEKAARKAFVDAISKA